MTPCCQLINFYEQRGSAVGRDSILVEQQIQQKNDYCYCNRKQYQNAYKCELIMFNVLESNHLESAICCADGLDQRLKQQLLLFGCEFTGEKSQIKFVSKSTLSNPVSPLSGSTLTTLFLKRLSVYKPVIPLNGSTLLIKFPYKYKQLSSIFSTPFILFNSHS
ncbi:Hypothetical_protein [Hexamita inflata]|uniref:Hypothetical_protein n=1 Tax=Hexamita inflata TaxID=28002 RepID=A0AA86PGB2_9EUKA|nr:Hypothetical protein HINF_LOCUS24398 [Hexamita inflata]